ncbi:MAG: hypothetical protein O3A00_27445, partial [Planctomycetota bacterium]|nr:hypothetical protein [Planctomycetota bacterium]
NRSWDEVSLNADDQEVIRLQFNGPLLPGERINQTAQVWIDPVSLYDRARVENPPAPFGDRESDTRLHLFAIVNQAAGVDAAQSILADDITVNPWDINSDGVVQFVDIGVLINHGGETAGDRDPKDANGDGRINVLDINESLGRGGLRSNTSVIEPAAFPTQPDAPNPRTSERLVRISTEIVDPFGNVPVASPVGETVRIRVVGTDLRVNADKMGLISASVRLSFDPESVRVLDVVPAFDQVFDAKIDVENGFVDVAVLDMEGMNRSGAQLLFTIDVVPLQVGSLKLTASDPESRTAQTMLYGIDVRQTAVLFNSAELDVIPEGAAALRVTIGDDGRPTFAWSAVSDAQLYQTYVTQRGPNGRSQPFLNRKGIAGTEFTPRDRWIGASYKAEVRGFDARNQPLPWGNRVSFDIQTLPLVLEVEVADDGRPTLSWTDVPEAETYQIYVTRIVDGRSQRYLNLRGIAGTEFTSNLPWRTGKYKAEVRGFDADNNPLDWSNRVAFYVHTRTPILEVATADDGRPTLAWTAGEDAETYQLYVVYTDAHGDSRRFLNKHGITANEFTPSEPWPAGTFKAEVRGFDADGNPLEWSNRVTFANTSNANRPVLTVSVSDGRPAFNWSKVSAATSYQIYVTRTDESGRSRRFLNRTGIEHIEFTPNVAWDGGVYKAEVRGFDSANQPLPWSNRIRFEIYQPEVARPPARNDADDSQTRLSWAPQAVSLYVDHDETHLPQRLCRRP